MNSFIKVERNIETRDIIFSGRISIGELCEASFDNLDLMVLNSPANNMADVIQSLQIMSFRIQQMKDKDMV